MAMTSIQEHKMLLSGLASIASSWSNDIPSMNEKRRAHAAVVIDKYRFMVIGGFDGRMYLDSVEIFNVKTNEFQLGPSLNQARSSLAAARVENKIYVFGGYGRGSSALDSIECLDLSVKNSKWKLLNTKLTCQRNGCTAAVVGHLIYIIGGRDKSSVDILHTRRTDMIRKGPSMTTQRCGSGAAVVGTTIYVFGGCYWEGSTSKYLYTIECLNVASTNAEWKLLQGHLSEPKYFMGFVMVGSGCVMIVGGYNGREKYLLAAEIYYPKQDVCIGSKLSNMTTPRTGPAAVALENTVYVTGGNHGSNYLDSMECMTFQRMDHALSREEWYKKALLDGSVPPTQIRLMMVGPYGMGKTSLVRSLRGEDFVPTYESTEGIRADKQDIGATRGFIVSAKNWVATQNLEDDNVAEHLVVEQDDEEEEEQQKKSANKEDEERLIEDDPPQGFQEVGDLGSSTTYEVMDSEDDHQLSDSSDRVARSDFDYGSITMTIWDFAGQIKYHSMHQMFFRSNSLYVLVLDLQEEDSSEQPHRVSSVEEMIVDAQLWLNAIVSSTGPNVGFIVVGTHADCFSTMEDAKERLQYLLDNLGERLTDVEWYDLLGSASTVVVDNKNGKGLGTLKRVLVDESLRLLNDMPDVPLRWLRLGEKLTEEAKSLEKNEFCVKLDNTARLSNKLAFRRDEIFEALSFLDEAGDVIYCQEEGLKQWVFPEPMDLLYVVTSLIAPAMAEEKPRAFRIEEQWLQLKEHGKLSNRAFHFLFSKFKHQEVLRRMLVECSVAMDFKDCIVVPALLPSTVPKWPSIMEGEREILVDTECSTHLPPSLFPHILAHIHRRLGTPEQELALLSNVGCVLCLDPTKWEDGNTTMVHRIFICAEQLRHSISMRIRAAPQREYNGDIDADTSSACIVAVQALHEAAQERFKWMTLRSRVQTIHAHSGLKHSWCMMESSRVEKDGETEKVVKKRYSSYCPQGVNHSLSDAVALVADLVHSRQSGIDDLIRRSETERQKFQPRNTGFFDRWDSKKCALAAVEEQLVSETSGLYRELLCSDGIRAKISCDNSKETIELLQKALDELLQVYLLLTTKLAPTDLAEARRRLGERSYHIFLSHRGDSHPRGDRIKQYVGHLHSKVETSGYTAFFDRKAMMPGDSSRESMIWAAMTCKIGVVVLSSSFFDSRWCLREFGIFSARRVLDGKRNPGPEATFALLPDAYEPCAIDLKMTHGEFKVPKWELPQCVIRREPLDSDHARQVTDAIDSTMRAMEVGRAAL